MSGKDVLVFLGILAAWFALTRWILPALGIPTCCSGGACSVDAYRSKQTTSETTDEQATGDRLTVQPRSAERVPPCPLCVPEEQARETDHTGSHDREEKGQ